MNSALLHILIAIYLTVFVVLSKILPYRFFTMVVRRLTRKVGTRGPASRDSETTEKVILLTERIARALPLHCSCLMKALTARAMLGLLGVEGRVLIGIKNGKAGKAEAHAWIESSNDPNASEFKDAIFRENPI